ncbi:MAG: hypothetical protein QY317_07785 [Candidatus Jettenia caeni]|nr:MAG: hypothetical protein QY317_07785 [Candidatus Jettenia caeni]
MHMRFVPTSVLHRILNNQEKISLRGYQEFGTGVPHLLCYGFKEEGLEMNRQVRIYSCWLMSMLFLLSGVLNNSMTAYGQPVQSEKPV